jgi:serine/threonine-protein kinase HipA
MIFPIGNNFLDETVENEAFCMELARRLGIPAAVTAVRKSGGAILVVTRYDRETAEGGAIVRLHQEDFCQALGILPEQKYESEGGPSLVQCFDLLKKHSARPAADQRALLEWVIFNVLIGNADAHAKNLSILLTDKGPRLAPFYDLLSTQVYPGLAGKLAMRIGGENRAGYLQARHWERFAESVFLKRSFVAGSISSLAERIVPAAESVSEEFKNAYDSKITGRIMELVRKRADTLTGKRPK